MTIASSPCAAPPQHGHAAIIPQIMAAVAEEFGLSEPEMMAPTRRLDVWKPRMAAMYYARLLTDCSLPELGRAFGGRSHTTVLRACRNCRAMIEQDPHWAARMDRLLGRLVTRITQR